MYIRQTNTRKAVSGNNYSTFRIVISERVNGKVKQRTILNLGSCFQLPAEQWGDLCTRIENILSGQTAFFPPSSEIESLAQNLAAKIMADRAVPAFMSDNLSHSPEEYKPQYEEVDINSSDMIRPRSVGVEHVGLHAARLLGLPAIFSRVGFSSGETSMALGAIIARMAHPASEAATLDWLVHYSALGELLDIDYEKSSVMSLHRISDLLFKHRDVIEPLLFSQIQDIFSLPQVITLYDLTNTYFEGEVRANPKARRGHSKEKRTDCPLLTLALVLDGSGFVRSSKVFAGNASEPSTAKEMLNQLAAPKQALVIMDRGISTADNIKWLNDEGYRYLVVSREQSRKFDFSRAQTIKTAADQGIQIYRELNEDGSEARLYCYSPKRESKETAMTERMVEKFEASLRKMNEGLNKPRTTKTKDKIMERLGRLEEKYSGIGRHYNIAVSDNALTKEPSELLLATAINFEKKPVPCSMMTDPGVYCLRCNDLSLDAETLWRTYASLTDLEAVFRSLKSELGLRPIYHHKGERAEGHLFITVMAYQCVQVIRTILKDKGIHYCWMTLRQRLSRQDRNTSTYRQKNGTVIYVRKATAPEMRQQEIYDALNIEGRPGGIKKYKSA
jgi:transposase